MKLYRSILLVTGIVLAGCEDFLSKIPDNRTQLDSKEKISEVLVTAYPDGNYMPFCEAMSDNVEDNLSQSQDVINTDAYFWRDITASSQDSPENYWNTCYSAIAAANHALQAIEQAGSPAEYNAERGEGLICRAYAHFMLVNLFSQQYDPSTAAFFPGIPYVTEPETESLKGYTRGTVQSVYEMIEKDLVEALPLINDEEYVTEDADASGVPHYHFTRAAAQTFATRFYLFKRDWNKVIEHAGKVFNNGDFAANLRPWNSTYGTYSAEQMMAAYTRSTEKANLLLAGCISNWFVNFRILRYSTGINRMREIMAPNPTGGNYAYSLISNSNQIYAVPKYREHFVRTSTNANTGFSYTFIPLLTAEEALLSRAEAYAQLERTEEALVDMNLWVSKRVSGYVPQYHNLSANRLYNFYGETNNQKATLRAVLDLRRTEFVHEGMRWFDIRRHNITVVHTTRDGERYELKPGDPRRALQLPAEAITLAGLEPNPR